MSNPDKSSNATATRTVQEGPIPPVQRRGWWIDYALSEFRHTVKEVETFQLGSRWDTHDPLPPIKADPSLVRARRFLPRKGYVFTGVHLLPVLFIVVTGVHLLHVENFGSRIFLISTICSGSVLARLRRAACPE